MTILVPDHGRHPDPRLAVPVRPELRAHLSFPDTSSTRTG
jgi:hypothetical protein